MNIYRIKKLIKGFEVDPSFKGKVLVAVPERKTKETLMIVHGDDCMELKAYTQPLHELAFKDKFDRNRIYTLFYYEWKPVTQIKMFELPPRTN